jgi:hypothetical protein
VPFCLLAPAEHRRLAWSVPRFQALRWVSGTSIFREVIAPKVDFFVLGSAGEDFESIYTGIRYNF